MIKKITFAAVTAFSLALTVPLFSSPEAEAAPAPSHGKAQPEFSDIYNPRIPESMTFCGKKIDFDRTDKYERLDRELTSLAYTHGNTLLIIKRANRFFPIMAPILKANGIPSDFLYLACVESTLNQRAYSPAKAAGIWQFIPSTAKQYGLEVSDEVDERYNLEKATAAACRYFKNGYSRYGDWTSVMSSFNGGLARISNELEAQGQDNSLDLYLAEETTRYPYRIMALKIIMENPSDYGFHIADNQLYQPRKYKTVTVDGPVESWPEWAAEHGISYSTLREENPWIRAKSLTNKSGKTYKVNIPLSESLSRKKAGTTTYNSAWTDR